MIALDVVLAGQQLTVPGRLLPVDAAPVHAAAELAERMELRAAAEVELDARPARASRENSFSASSLHRLRVQGHRQRPVERLDLLLPHQAQRAAPARPQLLRARPGPGGCGVRRKPARADARRRLTRRRRRLDRRSARWPPAPAPPQPAARAAKATLDQGLAAPAGGQRAPERSGRGWRGRGRRRAARPPAPGRRPGRSSPARPATGPARTARSAAPPARLPPPGRWRGRWVDHRGASTWPIRPSRASSTLRPSISAAGDRITRWRRAGRARALTSSGMT